MSCTKCGSRTTRSRVCKQCALHERYTPARDDTSQSAVTYECTGCGAHYRSDDNDECPECGSHRRRYAGELAPDGGTVQACPECESSSVFPTPGGIVSNREADWRCDDCDARFDEPIERAPDKNSGGHTSAPGQKLLNADPDEALPDGGDPSTESTGLHQKYEVYEDGDRVPDCFVLEPTSDHAARMALLQYAQTTDDEALTDDLIEWIADIRADSADTDAEHETASDSDAEPHRLADAEPRTQPGDDGDDEPHRLAGAEPRTQPSGNGGGGQ